MKIVLIGPIPPPTHGMAVINKKVIEYFEKRGYVVSAANYSYLNSVKCKNRLLRRIYYTLSAATAIVVEGLKNQKFICYFGLSGGYGLLFELALVAVARLFRTKLVFHHHSFCYIYQRFLPMRLLSFIAGCSATHVCLSDGMAKDFSAMYNLAGCVFAISNAGLIGSEAGNLGGLERLGDSRLVVGMLSNLSVDKGVLEFIDVAKQSEARGSKVKFILAGPFESDEIKNEVLSNIGCINNIEYWGPVYNERKVEFYSVINVLLFPTRYANEAEPLVILDALAVGIPVISYKRGCIGELLDNSGGFAYSQDVRMSESVVSYLEDLFSKPNNIRERMVLSYNKYMLLKASSTANLNLLEKSIKDYLSTDNNC